MKLKPPIPIIRAALVAIIMLMVAWIGLDIPRDAVEQSVDQQLEAWQSGAATDESNAMETSARQALVVHVIDGDTATVLLDGQEEKLRFVGIDTPETEFSPAGAECYGAEATVRATELLSDKKLLLTSDPTQDVRDKHGRLLVYAQLPTGLDFGETMVTEGFAREYTYATSYAYQANYRAAEAEAKAAGRGLWTACN